MFDIFTELFGFFINLIFMTKEKRKFVIKQMNANYAMFYIVDLLTLNV